MKARKLPCQDRVRITISHQEIDEAVANRTYRINHPWHIVSFTPNCDCCHYVAHVLCKYRKITEFWFYASDKHDYVIDRKELTSIVLNYFIKNLMPDGLIIL